MIEISAKEALELVIAAGSWIAQHHGIDILPRKHQHSSGFRPSSLVLRSLLSG